VPVSAKRWRPVVKRSTRDLGRVPRSLRTSQDSLGNPARVAMSWSQVWLLVRLQRADGVDWLALLCLAQCPGPQPKIPFVAVDRVEVEVTEQAPVNNTTDRVILCKQNLP
jgi:hypothetical protein